MLLSGLQPETTYSLIVRGSDAYGNEASSDTHTITTSTDTRSPKISNLTIEGIAKSLGSRQDAQAQFVITWRTDEPATSQVEFGEGASGSYQQSTKKDESLTQNHLVIISGLTPSKVYHLRALSTDSAKNTGHSIDTIAVAPKALSDALSLVIQSLWEIFGRGER